MLVAGKLDPVGEIPLEEIFKPMAFSQNALARAIAVLHQRNRSRQETARDQATGGLTALGGIESIFGYIPRRFAA